MNNKRFLPPVATALLAAVIVLPLVDQPSQSVARASSRIVDLAVITARPAPDDAAYYHSNRIVCRLYTARCV